MVVIQSDANNASDCISGVPFAQTERKKEKGKKKSIKFVVCTFFFFIQSGLKEAVNRNCKSHKGETNGTIIFHYTFPRRGNTVAS